MIYHFNLNFLARLLSTTIIVMTVALCCEAADLSGWGAVQNGVRIGLTSGPADQHTVRVVLENMTSAETGVLVGERTGVGTSYNFVFSVAAPDGKTHRLLSSEGGGVVGGYLAPVVLSIPPGTIKHLEISQQTLFYVIAPGRTMSLDTLLRAHHSTRVTLEVTDKEVDWIRRSDPAFRVIRLWTGFISSGDLRP